MPRTPSAAVRRLKHYIAPVYTTCSSPNCSARRSSRASRSGRQGISDIPNQFHYYRLTETTAQLWGGYDAVYYFGGKVSSELEQRPATWAKLRTFPQLEGALQPRLGGVIDTRSRYCVFWGKAMQGRVAYALGYTGLGVAEPLRGRGDARHPQRRRSAASELDFVRDKPVPFPPEPLRFMGIHGDEVLARPGGPHRPWNLWLAFDRLGLGFDSRTSARAAHADPVTAAATLLPRRPGAMSQRSRPSFTEHGYLPTKAWPRRSSSP
ncbi:MAG: hypothetical protein R2705_00660 [Ilumatobacteraceae bacterium]